MPVKASKDGITRYFDNSQWDAMGAGNNGWTLIERIDVEKPEARRPYAEIAPPRVVPTGDPLTSIEGLSPIFVETFGGVATVGIEPASTDGYVLTWNDAGGYWEAAPPAVGVPAGTDTQTLRYNGTTLEATSALRNDGTNISIGQAPTSAAMLKIKQTGDTNGIAIERDTDTRQLQLYQDGNAVIQSTSGNLDIKATSGQLNFYGPGGGSFISQIFLTAQSNITSVFGNSDLLRFSSTYAPSTSGGDFSFLKFLPTVNQSGSANQNIYALDLNPTLTSVLGDFYGIRYWPSAYKFLWQPNGASVISHLRGVLGVGSSTTAPAQTLHVGGTMRLTGSDGTAIDLMGRDADGDVSAVTVGTGLDLTAGVLSSTVTAGVTSVALSMPTDIFDVAGSPITGSGTFTVTLDNQAANTVWAGPTTGSATTPAFRTLVANDIPNLDAAKITSGVFPIARGGTGLSALGTDGQLLRVNTGATALEYFTPTYISGNQTITLSGDVTGSGTTAITTTIANDAVTFAKFQNLSTDVLVGRDTAGAGDATEISVGGGIEFTGSNGIQTSAFTGDVTKSAGGTALTIASDAVTFAKMQNIATQRIIGRNTAGTGDPEELQIGTALDWISATQGAVLYRGASGWAALAPGTSGQFLQTQGAGANPQWATGGGLSGSGVTGRLAIWSGTSSLTSDDFPLFFDTTNNKLGVGTASPAAYVHIGVPTGTSDEGLRILGNLSANLNATISNANAVNGGANTFLNLQVGGTASGDPAIQFSITGGTTWAIGPDNSNSDRLRIVNDSSPSGFGSGLTLTTGTSTAVGLNNTNPGVAFDATLTTSAVGLPVGTTAQRPAVNQSIRGNSTVTGLEYRYGGFWHRLTSQATPTTTIGSAAGTGATKSNVGNDLCGSITINTGSSGLTTGTLITVTFNQAHDPSIFLFVTFTAANDDAANEINKVRIGTAGNSSFTLVARAALTANTTYTWHYIVKQ